MSVDIAINQTFTAIRELDKRFTTLAALTEANILLASSALNTLRNHSPYIAEELATAIEGLLAESQIRAEGIAHLQNYLSLLRHGQKPHLTVVSDPLPE